MGKRGGRIGSAVWGAQGQASRNKQQLKKRSGSKQQLSPKPHSLHPKRTGNKQQLRKLQPESARQALRAAAADF